MSPPKPARLWDPPRLVQQRNFDVSWLELFFDFIFVVGLTGLSCQWSKSFKEIEDRHGSFPLGLRWKHFCRLFVLVGIILLLRVWRWEVFYQSVFDGDNDLYGRILTMLMIFSVGSGYITMQENDYLEDVSHAMDMFISFNFQMRFFHFFKFARAMYYQTERIISITGVLSAIFFECSSLLVIYFLNDDVRMIVLLIFPFLSMALQFSLLQCGDSTIIQMSRSHIIERFEVFVILLLGQAVVISSNITAEANIHKRHDIAGYGAFISAFTTFWIVWVYYDNSRRESQSMTGFISFLWHLSHVLLVPSLLIHIGTTQTIFQIWIAHDSHHTLEFSVRFWFCISSGCILVSLWWARSAVQMGPVIRHWRVAIGLFFALLTTLVSIFPMTSPILLIFVFVIFTVNLGADMYLHSRRNLTLSMHELLNVKENAPNPEPETPIQTQSHLEMKLRQAEHEILLARKALSDVYTINEKLEESNQFHKDEVALLKQEIESYTIERVEAMARIKLLEDENARVVELERKTSEQLEEVQKKMEETKEEPKLDDTQESKNSSEEESGVLVNFEDSVVQEDDTIHDDNAKTNALPVIAGAVSI